MKILNLKMVVTSILNIGSRQSSLINQIYLLVGGKTQFTKYKKLGIDGKPVGQWIN
jgi:hypothetical protein